MEQTNKILHSFLRYSIKEMEQQLKEIKPYWKNSTDPNEKLEYEKRLGVLNDLKEQLKTLENKK
jgi:hypothetical protein